MKSLHKLAQWPFSIVAVAILFQVIGISQEAAQGSPADYSFTSDGKLQFPASYREWIFLSSGSGMTYGPSADPHGPPQFDNVFVNSISYRAFLNSGKWPEQSIFVLEIRDAKSEGSINRGGRFQGGISAVEVLVKDNKRFSDTRGWGFFEFEGAGRSAAAKQPKTASCYACHAANGAVEHTFVQFYPTLIPVAEKFKTLRIAATGK
jgi:hypothetical protein